MQYRIGGRLPLHPTGIGLVLLAFAPHEVQEEFLAKPIYRQPGNMLIPSTVMRRTLAEVRRERLAIYRRQETEVIVALAAPIYGEDNSVVAALGVLLPERGAQPRRLGLAVLTAARGISRELGARQAIGLMLLGCSSNAFRRVGQGQIFEEELQERGNVLEKGNLRAAAGG